MKQDDVAGKVLLELLELKVIHEKDEGIIIMYLQQAFAAGFDFARMIRTYHKPVIQLTLDGTPIKEYSSGAEASRKTGIDARNISKCTNGKQHTAGGFLWEHKYVGAITTSEQRKGSYRGRPNRQALKTHVSKTSPPSQ